MQKISSTLILSALLTVFTLTHPKTLGKKHHPKAKSFRIFHLFPSLFPQTKETKIKTLNTDQDIQSLFIIKEFSTLAVFDVMYFSPQAAASQEIYLANINNLCEKSKLENCLQAINQQQNILTFYIQSDIKDSKNTQLEHADCAWKINLSVDDQVLMPDNIACGSPTDILQKLFGNKYSRRKKLYKVDFDLNKANLRLTDLKKQTISLEFRSYDKKSQIKFTLG